MIFSNFSKPLNRQILRLFTSISFQFSYVNIRTSSIMISLLIMLLSVAGHAGSVPQPLSSFDIVHYKRLLELQKAGNM